MTEHIKSMFLAFLVRLTFFLTLLICANSYGQGISLSESLNLRYSGSLGAAGWYFPQEAPFSEMPDYTASLRGQLDLTLQFDAPLEIRANHRFQYDPDNSDRHRIEIEDLYLDYYSDNFELRAGYQIFSWKTVESVSQADFLNQTDLESDFLDAEKLSELAVRLRLIPNSDIEQVFELYYIARLRAAQLPVLPNRFSIGTPVFNERADHTYLDENEEWRPQFAISYQRPFFDNVDTRFFYFNGYNRFPGLITGLPEKNGLRHQYRPVHKAGMTFQGEIGPWLVKGENVYTAYQDTLVNQLRERIKPSFFSYTLGFEYTFYSPLIDGHDLGWILELIGDSDSGKSFEALESFRPFRNHLFTGFRYTFNNVGDRSLLFGTFVDYREGDLLFQIEYEERLMEVFTVKAAYNGLQVDTNPLTQFEHTERFILEINYNF